jgi:hypothetical protein
MGELSLQDYIVKLAVLEERLLRFEDAKKLQAAEYERRLQSLNHAHEQAIERNAEFVSSELHNATLRELRTSVDTVRNETLTAAAKVKEQAEADVKVQGVRLEALSAKVNIGIGIILTIQVIIFILVQLWRPH